MYMGFVTQQKFTITRYHLLLQHTVIIRIFTAYWLFVFSAKHHTERFPMGLWHQTTAKLKQRSFPFQTLNFHHVNHRRQYRLMPQEFVQHIWCIQDALAEQYIYTWNKKCSVHIPDMQLGQSIYKRCMGCMRDSVHIQPAHTLEFVNSLVQKSKSCFFPTRFKALST